MAIRMRRGNEADFDPEKMLPGEWAVSTDTKYVRMCFAPGIVLRMATYEAFESDMAEIRKILLECQSIQTAVELIQNNVTNSELVIENYVKEAKQYRDEAEQYRNETEQFRNEAFSTTSGLIINNTARGDTIHLTDSAKSKVLAFGLYGKAVQNKYSGKNLIPYPHDYAYPHTNSGLTFTYDEETGYITVNGTANSTTGSYAVLNIQNRNDTNTPFYLPKGEYKATGCPSDGGNGKYRIAIGYTNTDGSYSAYGMDDGNGFEFEVTDETRPMQVQLIVYNGYTANNLVFKPMIRPADIVDDTYEPYVGGIPAPSPDYPQKITISKWKYDSVAVTLESGDRTEVSSFVLRTDGLAGIPVDSEGNYTDENGQQWICDEIVKYADGTGKRIQRIGMKIYNGSEDTWGRITQDSYKTVYFYDNASRMTIAKKEIISNMYLNHPSNSVNDATTGYVFYNASVKNLFYAYGSKEEAKTIDDWKTFLSANNLVTYYVLETPIETDLTADELKAYENLQTFYPVTNVSNNANCGMSITYVADTKNYIDNKIASLEKALYNNI